jgi:NADPH-dependent F420 reductase
MAGYPIVIGSRDAGRAAAAASRLLEIKGGLPITGAANDDAVQQADWALLTVPFDGLEETVRGLATHLAGKLVTSVVAPLVVEDGVAKAVEVAQGSAAELVASLLPGNRVTSAFHNLSARELLKADEELGGDVVVCGNDDDACAQTVELAASIRSLRGVDAGALSNSRYVEDLTALLLNINRRYKARSTIRFVGL